MNRKQYIPALLILSSSTCIFLLRIAAAQEPDNQGAPSARAIRVNTAQSDGYTVTATRVQALPESKSRKRYWLTFSYEFRNRDTIEIREIGVVPASGTRSYISYEKAARFRDSIGGSFVTVPLKETRPPEGSSVDAPQEGEFKPSGQSDVRRSPEPMRDHFEAVLNQWFSGYLPQTANGSHVYISTYRPLEGIAPNLQAQIAVRISFPTRPINGSTRFRVQFLVRQKPLKSDIWKFEMSSRTQRAAEQFMQRLITKIKAS